MSPIENTPIPHWIIFSLTDRRSGGQCHQSVECCVCGVTERHFTSSQESEKKKRKNLPFAQRLYSTAQQSLFISKCWWQWKWKCIFLSLLRSESQCQPFNLSSREAFFYYTHHQSQSPSAAVRRADWSGLVALISLFHQWSLHDTSHFPCSSWFCTQ